MEVALSDPGTGDEHTSPDANARCYSGPSFIIEFLVAVRLRA
jgi:hypothetical protein